MASVRYMRLINEVDPLDIHEANEIYHPPLYHLNMSKRNNVSQIPQKRKYPLCAACLIWCFVIIIFSLEIIFSGILSKFASESAALFYDAKFVKYPHTELISMYLGGVGYWSVGEDMVDIVDSRLDDNDINELDTVQEGILSQGLFLPGSRLYQIDDGDQDDVDDDIIEMANDIRIHLFSQNEILQCLSSRELHFVGDTNVALVLVGLRDMLFNDISTNDVSNVLEYASLCAEEITYAFADSNVNVQYSFTECYAEGMSCYLDAFSTNIDVWSDADMLVMNVLYQQFVESGMESDVDTESLQQYVDDISAFFRYADKKSIPLTWLTSVHYNLDLPKKINENDWNSYLSSNRAEDLNLIAIGLAESMDIPILDVETITAACVWSNCSTTSESGEITSSRFVNRMKMQLLLNNFCEV